MEDGYIAELLRDKKKAKATLTKELKLEKRAPLIAVFLEKELSKRDEERLAIVLDGLDALDSSLVILADTNLQMLLKKAKVLPYNRLNRSQLLQASDMALAFDFNDVDELLIHGVIPITLKRSEVSNYDPNKETGNAFTFQKNSPWAPFVAIVRASETYRFPYDWKHIVRQCVDSKGVKKN